LSNNTATTQYVAVELSC